MLTPPLEPPTAEAANRPAPPRRRTPISIAQIALEVALSLGALGGGSLFVVDPTGSRMGMTPDQLSRTPFTDYRAAGLLLLAVHGVGPWIAIGAELARRSWAPWAHLVVSGALLTWMAVQVATMGLDAPVQAVMIGQGAVMALLAGRRLISPTDAPR